MKTALTALVAAAALAAGAEAAQKPVWEIGLGAFATYSPEYWGANNNSFGGFPVAYLTYRGEDFSILPNGLFSLDASSTKTFDFGLSIDGGGKIKSADRLNFGDIDYVGEIGPRLAVALYKDGHSRFEVAVAARAAFEWNNGYVGYVIQPEVTYLTELSSTTRIGFSVSPKFGFDGYNQLYYSTPLYAAKDGYMGTELSFALANDVTDRLRFSAKVTAIGMGNVENEASPLFQKSWNYSARVGFTYAIWQSDEMTSD